MCKDGKRNSRVWFGNWHDSFGRSTRAAIEKLLNGFENGERFQVLMGATGTGKTFTMANVIQNVNKPTLVLTHNKTLAMQLYIELKELFPNNRVEYYVSNFDFYQPRSIYSGRGFYILIKIQK
jgi:excinuclease ABC subunit B